MVCVCVAQCGCVSLSRPAPLPSLPVPRLPPMAFAPAVAMRIALASLLVLVPLCAAGVTPGFDLKRYNDFPEFESYLENVAEMNPDFVQLKVIGRSHEKRRLMGIKIGKPSVDKKPVVWLDGGNHAREWPAFHTAVYFIEQLVNGYKSDPIITNYINMLDFYVFPVLNPDGFIYSRSSKMSTIRQWRKNRAPENCTGSTAFKKEVCCEGVDLNRNWDLGFKQTNYPFNNACSDEFQGPHPFSEPESRAVRDFITGPEVGGRVHALVSMHTHGQLWILPYNHHKKTYPEDYKQMEELALRAADAVYAYRQTKFRVGTAADMLGPATGGATDWIKKNTNTKYVYVLELPPDMSSWFAFQIKPHWLIPIGKETWLGVKVIIQQVLKDHNLPH